jgi:membrane-associated protease RseP (regulator of RpoE activity)
LKEYLSSKGITYQDHDVTTDSLAAQEIVKLTGQSGVPVTVIDGQPVVGFDQPRLEWLIAQAPTQSGGSLKFGAAVADVDKSGRKDLPIIFGAYVGRINPGSIAAKAGLTVGDIIIQLNNQGVSRATHLEFLIAKIKPGDTLSIVFIRGNIVNTTEVTI